MPYVLGVDLGTTYSATAVGTSDRIEIFQLGTRMAAIPSVVLLREDGSVLVGDPAERRSVTEARRTAREFKRRLGDPTPIVLGGTPYGAESLTAHLLRAIVDRAAAEQGERPELVVLTHPASFGPYKLEVLSEAVRLAEVGPCRFLSEPEAAAIHYSARERLQPGALLAVYDLGGGTLDVAALRVTDGGFEIVGTPEGMNQFGGVDLDEAVLAHVWASLGDQVDGLDRRDSETVAALAALRFSCREAKEGLSSDTDVVVPVMLPGIHTQVRLTRGEFEEMIRPRVEETLVVLGRVISSVGSFEEVSRVLLVGGASRIPLISEMIRASTGCTLAVDANPKHAVALGAARMGMAWLREMPQAAEAVVPTLSGTVERPEPTSSVSEVEAEPDQPSATPATHASGAKAVVSAETHGTSYVPVQDEAVERFAPNSEEESEGPELGETTAGPIPDQHRRPWWPWAAVVAAVVAATIVAVIVLGDRGDGDPSASENPQPPESSPLTTTAGQVEAATTAPGQATTTVQANTASPIAADIDGAELIMIGPAGEAEDVAVNSVLSGAFNDQTGAHAEYMGVPDVPADLDARVNAGAPPDLVILPDAATVVEYAAGGWLTSLEDLGLDVGQITTDYGDYSLGLVEYEGEHYGVPTRPTMKSLVWYHRPTFEARGYVAPTTWDDLMTLSARMVDDGLTPWCTGTESGESSGWPATDWVEDILLRSEGSATYDRWVAHEIEFDDPTVVRALDQFGEIIFGDGFVLGTANSIPTRSFADAFNLMAEGQCVMDRQADFILLYGADVTPGQDVGVFAFPSIDGRYGALIAPQYVAVAHDGSAPAAFLEWFVSREAQCEIGLRGATPYTSLHEQVGPECFADPIAVLSKDILEAAAPVDGIRQDGSDLMPDSIGKGAFLDAMNDYMLGGPDSAVEVLGRVEAAWP